jgi:hypothetical protein
MPTSDVRDSRDTHCQIARAPTKFPVEVAKISGSKLPFKLNVRVSRVEADESAVDSLTLELMERVR